MPAPGRGRWIAAAALRDRLASPRPGCVSRSPPARRLLRRARRRLPRQAEADVGAGPVCAVGARPKRASHRRRAETTASAGKGAATDQSVACEVGERPLVPRRERTRSCRARHAPLTTWRRRLSSLACPAMVKVADFTRVRSTCAPSLGQRFARCVRPCLGELEVEAELLGCLDQPGGGGVCCHWISCGVADAQVCPVATSWLAATGDSGSARALRWLCHLISRRLWLHRGADRPGCRRRARRRDPLPWQPRSGGRPVATRPACARSSA